MPVFSGFAQTRNYETGPTVWQFKSFFQTLAAIIALPLKSFCAHERSAKTLKMRVCIRSKSSRTTNKKKMDLKKYF
jgi:hypothetical protein